MRIPLRDREELSKFSKAYFWKRMTTVLHTWLYYFQSLQEKAPQCLFMHRYCSSGGKSSSQETQAMPHSFVQTENRNLTIADSLQSD